jgi:hypothetical protein
MLAAKGEKGERTSASTYSLQMIHCLFMHLNSFQI